MEVAFRIALLYRPFLERVSIGPLEANRSYVAKLGHNSNILTSILDSSDRCRCMHGAAISELMYFTDRAYLDAVTLPYATDIQPISYLTACMELLYLS
jgi:hypothetical protein